MALLPYNRIITYSDGSYSLTQFPEALPWHPYTELPAGNFKFILHDDIARDSKGQRIRAPEVWPLYWVEYSELDFAWSWYWFRVGLVHPYTGYKHWNENLLEPWEREMLKAEWRSLTHQAKAFTNNFGTDNCKDYVSGKNLSSSCKPAQGAITCCGNIVRVIGSPTAKGTPIETLDGTRPPPPIAKINRLTAPWLIFCSVNIPGFKVSGIEYPLLVRGKRIKADPFPNLDDHPTSKSVDTCVPLRTKGTKSDYRYVRDGVYYARNYIRTSRLVDAPKFVPNPYIQEENK